MTDSYHLVRDFLASPAQLWQVLTDPDLVSRWYGTSAETVIHAFDLIPGGRWLTEMRIGEHVMFQRADFSEIIEGETFTCLQANTDADWNVIDNMMMPDWPRILTLTMALTPLEGGTRLDLTWAPYNATDDEVEAFRAALPQVGAGWEAGMDAVDVILASAE